MSGVPMKYRGDPGARLWPRLVPNGSCLEWTGAANEHGYGVMTVAGKRTKAHRFAWELANDHPVPNGLNVLHTCDNPPCCEPTHLFLGDAATNAADMVSKGRHGAHRHPERWARGERHHASKLNLADVAAIRADLTAGKSISAIARKYSVARATIRAIRDRKTWQ